jgi:hypothetical protein
MASTVMSVQVVSIIRVAAMASVTTVLIGLVSVRVTRIILLRLVMFVSRGREDQTVMRVSTGPITSEQLLFSYIQIFSGKLLKSKMAAEVT